jgi:membrane-bound lytic murein transglycosylase B
MTRLPAALLCFAIAGWLTAGECAQGKQPQPYSKRPEVRAYIRELVQRHGFVEKELVLLFSRVRRVDPVLQAIAAPAEKSRPWTDYREMLVNDRRIAGGVEFWKMHRKALERAEREFGVPAEYVVAIIGVETLYGRNAGRWRVIDALSTLAFDYPPRADFFRDELTHYLLLARDEGINVFSTLGSYAGAFGIPQFMPGSARRYAVDFDGNGSIDLHRSPVDAIGSVANFLRRHGWQPGSEVLLEARVTGEGWRAFLGGLEPRYSVAELARAGVEMPGASEALASERAALIELESPGKPSEYRVGLQNFYVLTRYNRSAFYATAAVELARGIKRNLEAAQGDAGAAKGGGATQEAGK